MLGLQPGSLVLAAAKTIKMQIISPERATLTSRLEQRPHRSAGERAGGKTSPRVGVLAIPGALDRRKLAVDAVANYIAKYATKSLTVPGLPSRPICSRLDIDSLRCSRHYKQMIAAAWRLGARRATGNSRLRKAAHALGWGGH
jgi:hypothetical protein